MTLTVALDLKSVFQDPCFQTFSFPYFFITRSSHTCHSSSPFFIPFILQVPRPWFDSADPVQYRGERRFQGGISIPGGFQDSPKTLTDLIQHWGHWHFKWELEADNLQRSLTSNISTSLCNQKQREGLRCEKGDTSPRATGVLLSMAFKSTLPLFLSNSAVSFQNLFQLVKSDFINTKPLFAVFILDTVNSPRLVSLLMGVSELKLHDNSQQLTPGI